MDACVADVIVEFLSVAFHNIMHYASVYPSGIFAARKMYDIVVYQCLHPEVNEYVERWLDFIEEAIKADSLLRVEFIVSDSNEKALLTFVFDFERNVEYDGTSDTDAYLVTCEQSLRAYCLELASVSNKFKSCPAESFCINMFTNESTQISTSLMPYLQDFPVVEVREDNEQCQNIKPLKRFPLRQFVIDTYIEIPEPWSFLS